MFAYCLQLKRHMKNMKAWWRIDAWTESCDGLAHTCDANNYMNQRRPSDKHHTSKIMCNLNTNKRFRPRKWIENVCKLLIGGYICQPRCVNMACQFEQLCDNAHTHTIYMYYIYIHDFVMAKCKQTFADSYIIIPLIQDMIYPVNGLAVHNTVH